MTDKIDLDEMDVESDDGPDANKGDWVWRDDGDADAEPEKGWLDDVDDESDVENDATDAVQGPDSAGESPDDRDNADAGDGDHASDEDEKPAREQLPGVPRANSGRPVGVPIESGGAGGAAARDRANGADSAAERGPGSADDHEDASTADHGTGSTTGTGGEATDTEGAATGTDDRATGTGGETATTPRAVDGETESARGPHGGGIDDMTMALTFDAVQRLDDPRFAVIDAKAWTDWIGIVGDVPAYEINAFQREHEIDADFFSGAGQEPAERLADVDEHSMFYAERMVLVGVDGEEPIADRAGWEFVHLDTAAEKADWDLSDEG